MMRIQSQRTAAAGRLLTLLALLGFGGAAQFGCEDNDDPVEATGEAIEDAGDEIEDAVDDIG
jgi:hypothetical protein